MKYYYLTFSVLFFTLIAHTSFAKPSGGPSAGLEELFPGTLLDSDGKEVSKDSLAGKTVGIYFSAHWCPPCRSFTPNLVKFRDKNKKDFEVVFVCATAKLEVIDPVLLRRFEKITEVSIPKVDDRS